METSLAKDLYYVVLISRGEKGADVFKVIRNLHTLPLIEIYTICETPRFPVVAGPTSLDNAIEIRNKILEAGGNCEVIYREVPPKKAEARFLFPPTAPYFPDYVPWAEAGRDRRTH